MPTSNNITPEEKLLHIIENTKHGGPSSGISGAGKSRGLTKLDLSSLLRSIKIDPKHFSLKDINKVLIGLSVIASIFAVFYLAKESGFVKKRMSELRATPIKENSLSIDLGVDRPNASSYVTGTQKNNPFHLLPVEETAVEKKETETTDLKLVGILWSDSAQAIVEDPASAKTYMVYQGDMIENYKVEEITQTKVRLVSEYGEKILQ